MVRGREWEGLHSVSLMNSVIKWSKLFFNRKPAKMYFILTVNHLTINYIYIYWVKGGEMASRGGVLQITQTHINTDTLTDKHTDTDSHTHKLSHTYPRTKLVYRVEISCFRRLVKKVSKSPITP